MSAPCGPSPQGAFFRRVPCKKDIHESFNKIFAIRQEKSNRSAQGREDAKLKAQEFRDQFREHITAVIKPALNSVAELMQKNGIHVHIFEEPTTKDGNGDIREDKIGLRANTHDSRIGQGAVSHQNSDLQLEFSCSPSDQKVNVWGKCRTEYGATSSPIGSMALADVTENFIQKRVLALLSAEHTSELKK